METGMNLLRYTAPGINFERGRAIPELTADHEPASEFASMSGDFAWQDAATEVMINNYLSGLNGAPGSGKTVIIQGAAYHYAKYQERRSLIIVPMRHVANPYTQIRLHRNNGDRYE